MADPLIGNLVKRLIDGFTKEKSPEANDEDGQRDVIHKETETVLIGLSSTKINNIARYILQSLKEFAAKFEVSQPEETLIRTYLVIDYLLSLLLRCFEFQWMHIRSEYRKLEGLDQDAQMILKEKEEAISPPPLEEKIAADYIRIVTKIIPLIILQREQEPQKTLINMIG